MWLLIFALALAQAPSTPDDVEQGRRWYSTQCATCHGIRGDGGRGANLATPTLRHAPNDQALFNVITRGIPGTEMPRSALTPQQVRQVAAYVRTLGRIPRVAAKGNRARGEQVFLNKGNCRQCHTWKGYGGALGPDLTSIGARSSPGYIRTSLTDPAAATPSGFARVWIATRDGRRMDGVRINEDTFSIQIRDLGGKVHSLWKAELSEFRKDRQSPMPSYRESLTAAELDDLIAYLQSSQ